MIPADTNLRGRFHFVARQLSSREVFVTHRIEAGNVFHSYECAHFDPLGAATVKYVY